MCLVWSDFQVGDQHTAEEWGQGQPLWDKELSEAAGPPQQPGQGVLGNLTVPDCKGRHYGLCMQGQSCGVGQRFGKKGIKPTVSRFVCFFALCVFIPLKNGNSCLEKGDAGYRAWCMSVPLSGWTPTATIMYLIIIFNQANDFKSSREK